MKINTTIGVYANGDMKINGVVESNLKNHIAYNKDNRWGRGLFVNGVCVHKGYLSDEEVKFYERLFQSDTAYTVHKDTAPYV